MSNTDIVVAGHICLDISPEFPGLQNQSIDTLFRPGRLINMAGVSISDGGPVANTGFALARLGLNVLPMAGVGNDDFGSLISAIVQRETGRDIVRRDDIASSYSVILSPPGIDRIILHHPAGNDEFSSRDIDFAEVANAGYFHFGYPPLMKGIFADDGEELKRIYQKAKAVGAITSLDMSLPDVDSDSGKLDWANIIEETLCDVDIFTPSVEEILFMLDRSEYERIAGISAGGEFTDHLDFAHIRLLAGQMIEMGSAIAMIKCGSHGIFIKTSEAARMRNLDKPEWADKELFCPTYHVEDFKSALGSGDTTVAGFLTGMIRGRDLYECARIACQTGAACCTTYSATGAIPPLEEIEKRIANSPKQNDTPLPKGVLEYCEKERMYIG